MHQPLLVGTSEQLPVKTFDPSALSARVRSVHAPTPSYHCSCGLGFIKLAGLQDHLDAWGDDTDTHVQMALKRPELLARGLRRIRRELGLTMRDMGTLLGVDVSTISRIEADRRGVSRWHPGHVAMDLGVPLTELLRACPVCCYAPPEGFECLTCGTR